MDQRSSGGPENEREMAEKRVMTTGVGEPLQLMTFIAHGNRNESTTLYNAINNILFFVSYNYSNFCIISSLIVFAKLF